MSAAIIVAYVTFYAAVHSWLASQRVKDWARRVFGPETDCWYRLAFNVVVSVQLIPLLVLLVWLPDRPLYTLPPPWGWLAFLGQVAAFVGIGYGIWLTDAWHFLGLRQMIERTTDRCRRRCPPLVIFGLYRWVRHPLYFLGLVFIWLTPQMTVNRLSLFAALSVYLYVGTFFEERRLIAEFGPPYREYQRQVPRLFPYRGRVDVTITTPAGDKGC